MSNRWVTFWLWAGFPFVCIDAWLSIQSVFGIFDAVNPLGYTLAALAGAVLTGLSVYGPILYRERITFLAVALWLIALAIDVASSILGAIWYVVIGQPLNSWINFAELRYEPANTSATVVAALVVLAVALACVMFGKALRALEKRHQENLGVST